MPEQPTQKWSRRHIRKDAVSVLVNVYIATEPPLPGMKRERVFIWDENNPAKQNCSACKQ
jgi:hypothetical protein